MVWCGVRLSINLPGRRQADPAQCAAAGRHQIQTGAPVHYASGSRSSASHLGGGEMGGPDRYPDQTDPGAVRSAPRPIHPRRRWVRSPTRAGAWRGAAPAGAIHIEGSPHPRRQPGVMCSGAVSGGRRVREPYRCCGYGQRQLAASRPPGCRSGSRVRFAPARATRAPQPGAKASGEVGWVNRPGGATDPQAPPADRIGPDGGSGIAARLEGIVPAPTRSGLQHLGPDRRHDLAQIAPGGARAGRGACSAGAVEAALARSLPVGPEQRNASSRTATDSTMNQQPLPPHAPSGSPIHQGCRRQPPPRATNTRHRDRRAGHHRDITPRQDAGQHPSTPRPARSRATDLDLRSSSAARNSHH